MKKLSRKELIKFKRSPFDNFLTKLAVFVAILLVVGGGIGMILIQKELQESQDLRQQAYVSGGNVTITATGANSEIDQETKFTFKVAHSNGIQTSGFQFVFNVITDTFTQPPVFSTTFNSNFSVISEIEQTTDGFLIDLAVMPLPISQPFSTNDGQEIPFAELVFTPTQAGNVTLTFDDQNSWAPRFGADTSLPQNEWDELNQIANASLIVAGDNTANSCTEDLGGLNSVNPGGLCCAGGVQECILGSLCQAVVGKIGECSDPTCTYTYSSWNTCENNLQTRTVATQTPDNCIGTPDLAQSCTSEEEDDEDPGTGGIDLSSCNESCSSNNDCIANYRCYNDQCRLATNVSSSTCSAPADMGLSFGCNEYCADSNECSSELTCRENKCRNPENLASTTCADLTITQRNNLVSSCNGSCLSNNDCDVNLRCYKGACRLATNPSSFSCSPKSKTSLSENLYGAKTKGGKTNDETTIRKKTSAISKKDLAVQKGAKTAAASQNEKGEETALDFVKNWFIENPQLPIILIGAGLTIITIIILVAIIKSVGSNKKPPTPQGGSGFGNSGNSQVERDLQNRINSLKNSPPNTPAFAESQPPSPPLPPGMGISSTPPDLTPKPASSMMDKVKTKDIGLPGV